MFIFFVRPCKMSKSLCLHKNCLGERFKKNHYFFRGKIRYHKQVYIWKRKKKVPQDNQVYYGL